MHVYVPGNSCRPSTWPNRTIRCVRTPEFSYFDLAVSGVCAPGPGASFRRAAYSAAGLWNPVLRQIPDRALLAYPASAGSVSRA